MTIRCWYFDYLCQRQWNGDKYHGPQGSKPLKKFPNDFHVFIATNSQKDELEEWVKDENLNIHYKSEKAAHNYRYPTDGPKLWLYVLTVNPTINDVKEQA